MKKHRTRSGARFGGKEFGATDVSEQEWEDIEAYAEKRGIRPNRLLKVRVTSNQRPMLVYEGDDGLESDAIPEALVPARFRVTRSFPGIAEGEEKALKAMNDGIVRTENWRAGLND